MADFAWILLDAGAAEIRTTESFDSKEAAESWMGAHWSELLEEGGLSVRLVEDGNKVYDMGLTEG